MAKKRKIPKKKVSKLKRAFQPKDSRKKISRRTSGVTGLMKAFGGASGSTKGGRGRPSGTYKYGMPIHEYKKLQTQKKALYEQYQRGRVQNLQAKGLSPEQIKELQFRKAMAQVEKRNDISPYEKQQMFSKMSQKQQQVMNIKNLVDDELEFRRYASKNTVSPSAQAILTRVRRIQNKGKSDDVRQQRIHEERKIVGKSMNLMRAHENMNPIKLDFTGVNPEENILMAPSVFKENPEDKILRPRGRNILDTKENTLHF